MSFTSKPLDGSLVEPVENFVGDVFSQAVGDLGELVKIPGIAWPSFDPENLEVSARAVKKLLDELEIFDAPRSQTETLVLQQF